MARTEAAAGAWTDIVNGTGADMVIVPQRGVYVDTLGVKGDPAEGTPLPGNQGMVISGSLAVAVYPAGPAACMVTHNPI